jgi:hypothetical protein
MGESPLSGGSLVEVTQVERTTIYSSGNETSVQVVVKRRIGLLIADSPNS